MSFQITNSRRLQILSSILLLSLFVIPFQNCGEGPSAQSANSLSTPPPPPGTPPPVVGTCPYSANPAPVGSVSAPSVSLKVGMGTREGNGAQQNLTINYQSNDAYSRVTNLDCQVADNSGVNVNCTVGPIATSGQGTANISVDNDAECASGPVTVTVRASDAIYLGTAPDTRCTGLARNNSTIATFVVNRVNGCLPTQRVNPGTPYNNGQFGTAVAIDGMRAVSSAPGDEQIAVDAGAAFVMERALNNVSNPWSITAKLMPSGLGTGTILSSVALSGNTIALGSIAANGGFGGVWIFQFNGSSWVETRAITGPALASNFGRAVAVSGDVVAVGAPGQNLNNNGRFSGAVYGYSISGGNLLATLAPVSQAASDVVLQGEFGTSLAFSGARLAVGAPFPNSSTARSEAVYIYDNLILSKKIRNTANAVHRLGYSVSLDGNNLAVGAPYYNSRMGRAYLYVNNGSFPDAPTLTYNIPDANNADIDSFGASVTVRGARFVASAPSKAEDQINFGAAYLYSTTASTVIRKIRSYAVDRSADQFGYSIGISADGWLISGALNDDQNGTDNSGAAYFINVTNP